MLYLTCEHHNSLRWLVKSMAVNANGRYNGSRNLHFCGRVLTEQERDREKGLTPQPDRVSEMVRRTDGSVEVIRECPCSAESLIVAAESVADWQKEYPTGKLAEPKPLIIPRHQLRKALIEGIAKLREMKNEYVGTYSVAFDDFTATDAGIETRVTVSREGQTEVFRLTIHAD